MKILVAYFSQTENTRKIAEAIFQEAAQSNEAELSTIEDIGADGFAAYDLVFVGSPIHAGGLAAPVKDVLESIPEDPSFKIAAFITHASFAYEKQGFDQGVQQLFDISKDKNIDYLGCYDCQGRLSPALHDMVKQAQNVSDEEWTKRMAECDKHPNAEDEQLARDFTNAMIAEV
jgi:flavodoxin I